MVAAAPVLKAPSHTLLFRQAADILAETVRPWRYPVLAVEALRRLDDSHAAPGVVRAAAEDIREKMLIAGQFNSAYAGQPECVGVLRHWFPQSARLLLNTETRALRIPLRADTGEAAVFEALMRSPHMVTKNPDASPERRYRGMARGLTAEKAVSQWFRDEFPDMWEPPDNEGNWRQWCGHDFRLNWTGREGGGWLVDVMNPNLGGTDYRPPRKVRCNVHILARIDGPMVAIEGFQTGPELRDEFSAEEVKPISWLLVRLRCYQQGLNYERIKQAARA